MQPTVYNPAIPYQAPIQQVQPGLMITIHGTSGNGPRFGVSFHTGPGEHSDIAFHFAFRFGEQVTIRNSRIKGGWQGEERGANCPFPLQRNQGFQLMFLLQHDKFKVAINGRHYAEFYHRVPFHQIKNMRVWGQVQVAQIVYGMESAYPVCPVPSAPPPSAATWHHANPPILTPITFPFPNIRDHTVVIAGTPLHGKNKRFVINFENAMGDIYFHISSRFNEMAVVRNSLFSKAWGAEERQLARAFPFVVNQPFNIEISVSAQHFRISVNGVHLCDYPHRRKPLNQINCIKLTGDVRVSTIDFR